MKTKNFMIPSVIEQIPNGGQRGFDIYSRLLKDRKIFLIGEIDEYMANHVIAQLFYLEQQDPNKDIHLIINSPGGYVTAGLAVYDVIQSISSPVRTHCIGQACSMGAFLLAAGAKGKRYCSPNARVMIHQPSGGYGGQATDIMIHAKEMQKIKDNLNRILADNTGKTFEQVQSDTERDYFLSAQDALDYGLVDHLGMNFKKA